MLKSVLLALCLTLTSCVSLKTVSLTQIPKKRSNKVTSQVEKWVFLAFNFDNDFVDALTRKLSDQCQSGQVKGILTKHEVAAYFIMFKHTVSAKGYCI